VSRQEHWETIYATKTDAQISWTQTDPRLSLALIRETASRGAVIDVGAGTSVLADRLLDAGYHVTVLDISQAALARSQRRLGSRSSQVRWIAADVTAAGDLGIFDVWHDRAVFHFLTDPSDQQKYVAVAERSIRAGGHLIIGTFAPDGPEQCSGLPVERYDPPKLAAVFGRGFTLKKAATEIHTTPWGNPQSFHFAVLERNA
jgi:SAM-dependent methyltransferase